MSRAWRSISAFVLDWRNVATFLASVLTGLLVFLVIDSSQARNAAQDAASQRAAAATRRIDKLNVEIRELQEQIAQGRDERGQLNAAVDALTEQVRQMGGRPVLGPTPAPSRTAAPSPTSRPGPTVTPKPTQSPTPRPTRTPSPSPSPSPSCRVILLCL